LSLKRHLLFEGAARPPAGERDQVWLACFLLAYACSLEDGELQKPQLLQFGERVVLGATGFPSRLFVWWDSEDDLRHNTYLSNVGSQFAPREVKSGGGLMCGRWASLTLGNCMAFSNCEHLQTWCETHMGRVPRLEPHSQHSVRLPDGWVPRKADAMLQNLSLYMALSATLREISLDCRYEWLKCGHAAQRLADAIWSRFDPEICASSRDGDASKPDATTCFQFAYCAYALGPCERIGIV